MALYKNAYELAQKRKQKDDFVSALSQAKNNIDFDDNKNNNGFVNTFNSSYNQAGGQGNGFQNLGSSIGRGLSTLGNSNVGGSSWGSLGSEMGGLIGGGNTGSSSGLFNNSFLGSSSNAFSSPDSFSNFMGSSSASNSVGSSVPWGAIAGVAKGGYNAISGKDDKDYSDVEESIIYPLQGAAIGSKFGPWGAAGGAAYGLGYSFKDDLGLKDSNFLTQILFPIGMGDGGGLRIGGEPVLDLG